MPNAPLSIDGRSAFENDSSKERRTQERFKIVLPIHVRSIKLSEDAILEATTTLDVNRHGLSFSTSRDHYQLGMSLSLTFPYSSTVMARKEFVGYVVRVGSLPSGGRSVA